MYYQVVDTIVQSLIAFENALLIFFDVIILMAAISSQKDAAIPFPYIVIMTIDGILCKISVVTFYSTHLFLDWSSYLDYRTLLGKEITVVNTWTYLNALFFSGLMTVHRVWIVINPLDKRVFSQRRIFLYSIVIAVLLLVSLLIPYFSNCSINFLASTLAYRAACAPGRHPITVFQNTHSILVPFVSMIVNLSLVLHLKCARNGLYAKMRNCFRKEHTSIVINLGRSSNQRQEQMEMAMITQTIVVTAYLSFYEFGPLLMRVFPMYYNSLPSDVREAFFYLRHASVGCLNLFVYYVENATTRRMIREFLRLDRIKNRPSDASHVSQP